MIHYSLRCEKAHEFDGWFKSSDAFDRQSARHLIECPVCASTSVARALMAPRVARRGHRPDRDAPAMPAPSLTAADTQTASVADIPAAQAADRLMTQAADMPAAMRGLLQRVRAEIEQNCDYVGEAFADEARRIHAGHAEERPIYGEATKDEAESLAEEGIACRAIPWIARADS